MNRTLAFAAALALAGCRFQTDHAVLVDDIDVRLDFGPSEGDDLHSPYVRGAHVHIGARGADASSWRLYSSDQTVMRLDERGAGGADFTAAGEGSATIGAYDPAGRLMASAVVTVLAPDHAALVPHGPLLVGDATPAGEIRVLAGGTATYLVEYYRGDAKLSGNGVLQASSTVLAEPQTSFLFETREWLSVTSAAPGTAAVALSAGGVDLGAVPVVTVGDAAVAQIELVGERRADRAAGDQITVLALARDAAARPIYGVNVAWDLDGDGQAGIGDLFRYRYDPSAHAVLGAEFHGKRDETAIAGGDGRVDQSKRVGCSAAPGSPAPLGWLAAAAVALAVARRRAAVSLLRNRDVADAHRDLEQHVQEGALLRQKLRAAVAFGVIGREHRAATAVLE